MNHVTCRKMALSGILLYINRLITSSITFIYIFRIHRCPLIMSAQVSSEDQTIYGENLPLHLPAQCHVRLGRRHRRVLHGTRGRRHMRQHLRQSERRQTVSRPC
ncbi:hypothetical protein Tsp_04586 [Trichinella spiralis]|uniref:hypothetical protein n=1 Tax=Trichinella spiralis TaxID=6334 RepID=UPI0001EFD3A1|nr:hypothetical protein Tsp_04586 [Trichinella spiralis]